MELRVPLRLAVAILVALLVVSPAQPARGAVPAAEGPGAPGPWVRPVAGAVVRPFVAPIARYGPGHRGVDLAAPAGTPVRAANVGTVAFAGPVAGTLHVVVAHDGGLRTSYSFLARVDVRRGQAVARGQVVGAAGGAGDEHAPGVVHFGLRVGDRYVDPMALFSPPDLSRLIRLAPVDAAARRGLDPPALEQRWLVESLHLPRGLPGSELEVELDADGGSAWALVGRVAAGIVGGAGDLVVPIGRAGRRWLRATPFGAAAADARSMSRRLLMWARSRTECTADTAVGPGGGGSGHLLLAVGGVNSATDPATGAAFGLEWRRLGYRSGEVHWYSYAPGGGSYRKRDTWGDLVLHALALRVQLRALQRANPGREVDLVAHSQGGIVVDAFLQLVYDPGDPTLPPLGNVVTLAAPHQGAPIATVARWLRADPEGRAALRAIRGLVGSVVRGAADDAVPPLDSPAVRQLAESSPLLRAIWDRRLPEQVDMTTIGGTDDLIVPADHTTVPGATELTVNPRGPNDHAAIVADEAAMAAVRLALERRPPPCVGWVDGLRGAIEPVIVSRLEHTGGELARRISKLVRAGTGPTGPVHPDVDGQGGPR